LSGASAFSISIVNGEVIREPGARFSQLKQTRRRPRKGKRVTTNPMPLRPRGKAIRLHDSNELVSPETGLTLMSANIALGVSESNRSSCRCRAISIVAHRIETTALIAHKLDLNRGGWKLACSFAEHFNALGFAIIGLFAVAWAASCVIYQWKRFDEIEVISDSTK
jgi:hypothetical protein